MNYMNYKGPESLLLNFLQPCYSLPCINSSSQKSSVVVSEVCYRLPDTKSLFYVWNNCSVQLHYSCYGLLNLLWTHYYHLLPSLNSAPQSDRCRSELHLRLSIQTSSNRPECEGLLDSAQLLGCSWCCWWRLFKSMPTEALSTLSAQMLIIHSFRCSTVFSCWQNPASFLNIFILVWQNIFDGYVLSGWGRAAAFQTLNANVYFISDSTMMLLRCIFPLFFSQL